MKENAISIHTLALLYICESY